MTWLEASEPAGEGDSPCGKSVGFFLLAIGNLSGVGNRKDMIDPQSVLQRNSTAKMVGFEFSSTTLSDYERQCLYSFCTFGPPNLHPEKRLDIFCEPEVEQIRCWSSCF